MLEKFLVKHPWWARRYAGFFDNMTVDEFKMVPLPPGSLVITIGCGSFPHTIFTLVRERGWKFVAVDCDKIAVENARRLVLSSHLSSMVEIREGEGIKTDVSGFDLVLISHGVEPKLEVLENLGNKINKDGMIFYRTIWDRLEKIYGHEPIPSNLRVKKSYYRIDGIKSLLLVRSENPK